MAILQGPNGELAGRSRSRALSPLRHTMAVSNKERNSEEPPHSGSSLASAAQSGGNASLGITYGATVLVFVGLGWWLDDRFGTSPWLLIVGMLLGSVGGIVSLVKKVPPVGGGSTDKAGPQKNNTDT